MVSQLCVQPFRSSTPGRSQFVYVVPNAASAELPASLPRGSTDDSVIVSLPGYSAMNVTSDLPTALLRGTIARGQTNGASVMDSGIAPLFLREHPCLRAREDPNLYVRSSRIDDPSTGKKKILYDCGAPVSVADHYRKRSNRSRMLRQLVV